MIKVAIVHHSVLCAPILVATKDCVTKAEVISYANEMVENWFQNGQFHALEGNSPVDRGCAFDVDGHPKGEFPTFETISDELMVTANGGEESFIAAIDEATTENLSDGITLGRTLQRQVDDVDFAVDGLMTTITGGSLPLTEDDIQALTPDYTDKDKAILRACSAFKLALRHYP